MVSDPPKEGEEEPTRRPLMEALAGWLDYLHLATSVEKTGWEDSVLICASPTERSTRKSI